MIVNHPRASLRAANAGFGEKVFVPRRMQAATQRTENGKEAGGTNTRERLRRVALELFWEKGYRLTSTRDLATALGVKQASLYYHVKNKEELLHEICYNALQQVIEKVKAAAQRADTPIKKLGAIAQTHMVATLELQKEFLVAMYDYRSLSAVCNAEINRFWSDYEQRVSAIYDEAIRRGEMRKDIPHTYHYHAVMSMTNWSVLWYRPEGALPLDALGAIFSDLYLNGAACQGVRVDVRKATPTSPPREENPICETRNETHARLVDTASALFAAGGYATTSIRTIAQAMGVEPSSLYYYVPSKDALCYEIIHAAHEHMLTEVERAVDGVQNAQERMLRLIVAHVEALLEHQNWFAVANEQINFLDTEKRAEIVQLRDRYEARVRDALKAAQSAGVLRGDIDARLLGFALLGMITHIYPWYRPGIDLAPRELALLLADFFLHGVRQRPMRAA
jgi:AcrR family transcriptional regulator